jgi:hypothetical protein
MEYRNSMNDKVIVLVKDFHEKPYGRYITDADGCEFTSGEVFRINHLVPALRNFDHVTVDLNGYNRYGRSFLDEAFGGLIREEGFTGKELDEKLTIIHNLVPSILDVIKKRIDAAKRDCGS